MNAASADHGSSSMSEGHTPTSPGKGIGGFVRRLSLGRFSGIGLLAIFLLIFALWIPDTFFTGTTWQNIASAQAITAIVALGILFPLAAGVYDLSVGTMLGLSAVVAAKLTSEHGTGMAEVLLIALALGALVGVLNGFLIVGVGINSFIATLGMSSVLTAAIIGFTDGSFISSVPQSYQSLVNHQPLGIPQIALYAIGIAIVCWYVLEHTPFGRRLAAVGFNEEAARLAGVPTARLKFATLMISAVFASLAGALLTAKLATATPELGPPYLLPAFAAAFLGSTQLKPGRFNVWGTVLAIILLATGTTGLQLGGAAVWVTELFNGLALIIAVGFSLVGQRLVLIRQSRRLSIPRRKRNQ